jgi:hypothetical protein
MNADTFSKWIQSEGLDGSFRPDRFEFEFLAFYESLPLQTLETVDMDDGGTEGDNSAFTIFDDPGRG